MTGKTPSHDQSDPKPWRKIAPYAIFSFCSFLCAFAILALMIWHADKLVALGLVGQFFYMALLPVGLSVSATLFGFLRSFAIYRGKQFDGELELGGAIVAFFIVIVLGLQLPVPASNFSLTVYLHGTGGIQDLVLRGNGYVIIDIGGSRRKAYIGSDGEAYFAEIPANFRDQEVPVILDADGFELANPTQCVRLVGSNFYVEVRRKSVRIKGYVHDSEGEPLAGVKMSLAGLATSSDGAGFFELVISGSDLQPKMTLNAESSGFAPWSDAVVPNSNDITITLHRQR